MIFAWHTKIPICPKKALCCLDELCIVDVKYPSNTRKVLVIQWVFVSVIQVELGWPDDPSHIHLQHLGVLDPHSEVRAPEATCFHETFPYISCIAHFWVISGSASLRYFTFFFSLTILCLSEKFAGKWKPIKENTACYPDSSEDEERVLNMGKPGIYPYDPFQIKSEFRKSQTQKCELPQT